MHYSTHQTKKLAEMHTRLKRQYVAGFWAWADERQPTRLRKAIKNLEHGLNWAEKWDDFSLAEQTIETYQADILELYSDYQAYKVGTQFSFVVGNLQPSLAGIV